MSLRKVWSEIVLAALSMLELSNIHHWTAPHRKTHEYILLTGAGIIAFIKLVDELWQERQKTQQKRARLANTHDLG